MPPAGTMLCVGGWLVLRSLRRRRMPHSAAYAGNTVDGGFFMGVYESVWEGMGMYENIAANWYYVVCGRLLPPTGTMLCVGGCCRQLVLCCAWAAVAASRGCVVCWAAELSHTFPYFPILSHIFSYFPIFSHKHRTVRHQPVYTIAVSKIASKGLGFGNPPLKEHTFVCDPSSPKAPP